MRTDQQHEIPIQAERNPILCSPYVEPSRHWIYDLDTGLAEEADGRRPAGYYFKTNRQRGAQVTLPGMAEENWDELSEVNNIRDDVRRWRKSNYEGATNITKELLAYWTRDDRPRRLFFCQIEAVETIIYLNEIRGTGADGLRRKPRFNPKFLDIDFEILRDIPNEAHGRPLIRYCCKMATGSGKTVAMAMLISWAFCNRGQVQSDERFPKSVVVACPNLTVKERLQVLRPDIEGNFYTAFDMIPSRLRPHLNAGRVMVTNWHAFAPESEHVEGGKSWPVVNKGPEDDLSFAKRILGELGEDGPLMVLNDEAHHAYRPAEINDERLTQAEKEEREEATVWISGLDRFNKACGVKFCVDLSATPFYLQGSGHPEGAPFPWIVSDFGLVDAIESGIVKIPRIPVSDTTGRPEPKYFRLWENIMADLGAEDRLPGRGNGRPKPDSLWRKAEPALRTLTGQWEERLELMMSSEGNSVPPCLIIVCDNTDVAEFFFEQISGERIEIVADVTDDVYSEDEEDVEEAPTPGRKRASKRVTVYGESKLLRHFANSQGFRPTVRIDSKMLAEAENESGGSRQLAAEQLRRVISTVGKPGELGEHVRCVVSVAMLTEGWDANNVTHIFGLRAFGSQLLCEQVVGRALRRMDYTVDPETGLLAEEYADIYGIPFSVIPFRGRAVDKAAPEDRPIHHVKALTDRSGFEIRFPVVDGFAFALNKNVIRADVAAMQPLEVRPNYEPTAVFVKPSVGYLEGRAGLDGPGHFERVDRQRFYDENHIQTIEFEITRQVVFGLVGDNRTQPNPKANSRLRLMARHQLFPQALRYVHQYIQTKVHTNGADIRELGLETYVRLVVERLVSAIEPDDSAGESPLMPVLNRYKPFGTTKEVDFRTVREVRETRKSHISHVVLDTFTWEAIALDALEASPQVQYYARNDQLGFNIPYDYDGNHHVYEPDYLVRLTDGRLLILEVKGYETDKDQAKHEAAGRWVRAVNNTGKVGRWAFAVCRNPNKLDVDLSTASDASVRPVLNDPDVFPWDGREQFVYDILPQLVSASPGKLFDFYRVAAYFASYPQAMRDHFLYNEELEIVAKLDVVLKSFKPFVSEVIRPGLIRRRLLASRILVMDGHYVRLIDVAKGATTDDNQRMLISLALGVAAAYNDSLERGEPLPDNMTSMMASREVVEA